MNVTDPHGQEVQLKFFHSNLAAPDALVEKFCNYHGFHPPEACEAEILHALAPDLLDRLQAKFATGSKSPVVGINGLGLERLGQEVEPWHPISAKRQNLRSFETVVAPFTNKSSEEWRSR